MVVYKYLKREHLLEFQNKGSILVNTLNNLRTEHEAIRDESEGCHLRKTSKNESISFTGEEVRNLAPAIHIGGATFQNVTVFYQVPDAFVFSTSLKFDTLLGRKLGYDSYYQIVNPDRFAEIIKEKLNEVTAIRDSKSGTV